MKLNDVDPLNGIEAAPNALAMDGGPTTVIDAFDVLPVPPSVEVTVTLLFFTPALVPCTFTDTAHEALAGKLAPDRLIELAPLVAVAVPPQVLFRLGVADTTRPAGRLSVKAMPVKVTPVLGLLMLKVSEVVPFNGICDAPNTLVMLGGLATVRFADAEFPVPPFVEVTFPVVLV